MLSISSKVLILALSLIGGKVKGHGYLKSPRSRNWVAFEDGKEAGTATDPAKEYCPQCLNRGGPLAACGLLEDRNYDQPLNALGGTLPTNLQGSFAPGGEIEVDVVLTAHHKGHFEFFACAIYPGEVPTDDCFKQHPLEFISDPLYGAPKDPSYPHRAMIPPRDYPGILSDQGAVPGTFHRHRLALPSDIEGELVLLQWYYLTANSCQHPGYDSIALPSDWNEDYSHLPLCNVDDSDGGNGSPERFWNCAEISVTTDGSTPTTSVPIPAPSEPTTSAPYSSPPTSVQVPTEGGQVGTCGGGNIGNGVCPDASLCCSQWGHCGSTPDYCGEQGPTPPVAPTTPSPTPAPVTAGPVALTTPSPAAPVTRPPTDCNANAMTLNFGYYQSWSIWRQANCNRVYAADIDVDGNGYTHLAYSFAGIDVDGKLEPWAGDYNGEVQQYADFNAIKSTYPNLKTMIAVGGWTFNDPGATQTRFSDIASTPEGRATFADSVIDFLRMYDFDGIDFDWEYPADTGRGGKPADKANYALLVQAVRDAFNSVPEDFEISMAIPISTSKLDVGYDLVSLSQSLDLFNLMAYDIHGAWDWPKVVGAHSDKRVIESTINYMLQEGTPSEKIAMGLGTYGRIYTLSDSTCTDIGCPFSHVASGGCAGADGFMPYFTIDEYVSSGKFQSNQLNPTTGSMELVIDGNKWVSYDNKEAFEIKASFASDTCLGGYMWWAVDMLAEPMVLSINGPAPTPIQSPTEPPASSPTQVSTPQPPVESPTEPPTKQPVVTPTNPPTDPPVSSPTEPAPTNQPPSSDYVVSTTNRCGQSELDARANCGKECFGQADCASGEWCWGVHDNYCGSKTVEICNDLTQATSGFRCGINELEARELCGAPCSSSADCGAGETSCLGVHMNTCDCDNGNRMLLRGSGGN